MQKSVLAAAACLAAALTLAFSPGPGAALAKAPAAQSVPAAVLPFEPVRGILLIEVEIGGERVPAVYDSGASVTLLNSAYPRRAAFARKGPATVNGFGGRREGAVLGDVKISIGGRQMRWAGMIESDFSETEAALGRSFAAIIGVDAFRGEIITIDTQARQLRFTPRKRFQPPSGAAGLRFARDEDGLRVTDIEIAGVSRPAIVDTGSGSALNMSAAFAAELGIDPSSGWGSVASGAGGVHYERKGLLPSIRFAGVTLANVPVDVSEPDNSPQPLGLGAEILGRFRLHLDYAGNRLWAEPFADAASRAFDLPHLGAATRRVQQDRLKVLFISDRSPAAAAGLAPGDEILAVDGRPVAELPTEYSPAELREPGPITFTLADGRTITVQRRALDVVFQPARAE